MRYLQFTLLIMICCLLTIPAYSQSQTKIVGGIKANSNEYPFFSALMFKKMELTVSSQSYPALFMSGGVAYTFSGQLSGCGLGETVCNAEDKICLIERGENHYFEKAQNCQNGNGIAAIIYNNTPDDFSGILHNNKGVNINIPVVSVSGTNGAALLNLVNTATTVELEYSDATPTQSFCGGSYVGDGWVVTAAHCVHSNKPDFKESLLVNVGGFDLKMNHNNIIGVEEIQIHPHYNPLTVNNDIALVKLKSTPQNIQPVKLATAQALNNGVNTGGFATIIGRGLQQEIPPGQEPAYEDPVNQVFEVDLPLVSNPTCNNAYNATGAFNNPVSSSMVCAGSRLAGKGACFGDSGGPLLLEINNEWQVAGITSWGLGCAQAGLYDVYARVPTQSFMNMVEDLINENTEPGGTDSEIIIGLPPGGTTGDEFNTVPAGNDDGGGGSIKPSTVLMLFLLALVTPRLQRRLARCTKLQAHILS